LGFLLHPEPKRKSGDPSAATYASVLWLFCIGDYFLAHCYLLF
jgi:hypothetical protein